VTTISWLIGLFEIVVVAAVQSVFRLEMHQNDFFYFLKFFFEISTSKRSKNIKKNIKKNLKFKKIQFQTEPTSLVTTSWSS